MPSSRPERVSINHSGTFLPTNFSISSEREMMLPEESESAEKKSLPIRCCFRRSLKMEDGK